MTTYESPIKSIPARAETIYTKLSDMTGLRPALEKFSDERIKDLRIEPDSVHFTVENFGEMGLKMVNAEPFKTLKYEGDGSPIPFNFWVQLVEVSETDTRMKLTLKADIPMMLRPVIGSKIEDAMKAIADTIANFDYELFKD